MLFYGVSQGTAPDATWQFGLFFESATLDHQGAATAWSNFNQQLFVFGGPPATGYLTLMRPGQVHVSSDTYVIDAATDLKRAKKSIPGYGGGSNGTLTLPPQVAPMILLRGASGVRSAVGRIYLPPCSSSVLFAGHLDTTVQGNIKTWTTAAFAALTGAGAQPVVRSRILHQSLPASAPLVSSIFAIVSTRAPHPVITYL